MNSKKDPMGRAIADYFKSKKASKLRVFSPMFEEDEIPLATLFRSYESMPEIERKALDMAKGRVLDVGAGSGCHSLVLQEKGLDVTAIDISPLSVETMKDRGVKKVLEQNFFTIDGQYDTILMLMNGIGIVGALERLPEFFKQLDNILAPRGQVLCDSSDISYVFETEDGIIELPEDMTYYGEHSFQMQYKDTIGEPFNWLYIDADTLKEKAGKYGYVVEVVAEGEHYDYLARITKKGYMKWTVLTDNRTQNPLLQTEHGLSILLETEKHRILLDTGASDVFIRNAERLGIDLRTVDYVFFSHGHSDHAGGLKHFMEINTQAKVIVSPDALKGRFFSKRRYLHSITTEWPMIPQERLLTVEQSESIDDDIFILAHIPQIHPMPDGNQHLFVKKSDSSYVNDDFRHEQALYTGGLLFTGCAHSGLENILAACPFPVNTVVGGFHLLDNHESEDKLSELAYRLTDAYPQTQFYTSHCTGDAVFATLHQVMGDKIHAFSCGTIKCEV